MRTKIFRHSSLASYYSSHAARVVQLPFSNIILTHGTRHICISAAITNSSSYFFDGVILINQISSLMHNSQTEDENKSESVWEKESNIAERSIVCRIGFRQSVFARQPYGKYDLEKYRKQYRLSHKSIDYDNFIFACSQFVIFQHVPSV